MFNSNLVVYNIETDKSLTESCQIQMLKHATLMILALQKLTNNFIKTQFKEIISFVALKIWVNYNILHR